MDVSEAQELKIRPSQFAESVFMLDGAPFRLGARKYLLPIYDLPIEEGIIMSGRQVEKSTTNATKIGTATLTQPNFRALYLAPLTEQVKEFSRERIGKFYDYSQEDIVNRCFRSKADLNNMSMKSFAGSNSVNYFRHCYDTGDNIRGLTANGVWFDEMQDLNIDAIPVVKECQSHAMDAGAKSKITWYTGTPKTFSNTIQQYFERSTQNEWIVKCPHCNTYQILGVKNMTPTKLVCRKCDHEMEKDTITNGKWIPMDRSKEIEGFRISQIMVPWTTAKDLWYKYEVYPKGKFYNEVLGRSYENAEKPFTMPMLAAICENEHKLYDRLPPEFANAKIYMGIDWGTGTKSFTVVTIFAVNKFGKMQLIYTKRYSIGDEIDPDYQLKHIMGLVRAFHVRKVGSDWGFGYTQNNILRKNFGTRVAVIYYSANQNKAITYNKEKDMYSVNRTKVITDYINFVKEKQVEWPGKSRQELSFLFDMHLAEMAEYRKTTNGRSEELMYSHSESQPDDGLHSCNYARIAFILDKMQSNDAYMPIGIDMTGM